MQEVQYRDEVTRWFGLDLGQMKDPTALVGIKRTEPVPLPLEIKVLDRPDVLTEKSEDTPYGKQTITTVSRPKSSVPRSLLDKIKSRSYLVEGVKRFGNGTKYDVVIDYIVKMSRKPPLLNATLAIDYTGVGVGVVDMLVRHRPSCRIVPIMITAGSGASIRTPNFGESFSGFNVSKKDLVTITNIIMQGDRLTFAPVEKVPLVKELSKELQYFEHKVTKAGNDQYESWRTKTHDDIVLAASIALWVSECGNQQWWMK